MPRWFTQHELEVMDDLTANNKAVLASLGGAPVLPESTRPENYGVERRYSEQRTGAVRQRVGSIHR